MGVFALLQMLSHVTGTALSGMRTILAASRHPVKGFPLALVCINLRFWRAPRPLLPSAPMLPPLTSPSLCSKLCLQALRTGCAFRAIDTIAGGILRHARANKQSINVLHRLGVGCERIGFGFDVAHALRRQGSHVDILQVVAGQRLLPQGKRFPAHRAAAGGDDDGGRYRRADDHWVRGGASVALSCFCVYTAADQTVPCLRWRQQPRSPRCRSPRFERVVSTRSKTCSAGVYERANLRCAYCVMCVAAAMMGEGGGGSPLEQAQQALHGVIRGDI
jgi:hypothetical protein